MIILIFMGRCAVFTLVLVTIGLAGACGRIDYQLLPEEQAGGYPGTDSDPNTDVYGDSNTESSTDSDTASLSVTRPNAPTNFQVDTANSGGLFLTWGSGGDTTSGYILIRGRSPVNFIPVDTQSYTASGQGDEQIVYVGKGNTITDNGLINGETYYYALYAYDSDHRYSTSRTGMGIPQLSTDMYSRYRFQVTEAMSNCLNTGVVSIMRLFVRINNIWQTNTFSSCVGKIGERRVQLDASSSYYDDPSPCADLVYGPHFAFLDNTNPWSSATKVVSGKSPYTTDQWLEMEFVDGPVKITGLKIQGGETGGWEECAPTEYSLLGQSGADWEVIPGSVHSEDTTNLVSYLFHPGTIAFAPNNFRLLSYDKRIKATWQPGGGVEVGHLLIRGTKPIALELTDGTQYEVGPLGDFEIVYKGSEQLFVDAGLENGTRYYYKIYAYSAANQYSDSVIATAVCNPTTAYPYYRFVVDSNLGDGGDKHSNCLLKKLELQFDGKWASDYNFSSSTGTIDNYAVTVSESSFEKGGEGWRVFAGGDWLSARGSFHQTLPRDAVMTNGVYLELDLSANPAGITGWRAVGTLQDPDYLKSPDAVHMQRSEDGERFVDIEGSSSADVLWVEEERQW